MIADRLNPIVLKELRQGLKSKSFVASFLGLQVMMVVSMFIYFAAVSAGTGEMEFANGFFWFMLGVILMLFMPLRSFGALYGEIKGDTLEMLFLTRMSSWDITFGKWLELLMQIGLLVCAVLPYLVLRYYLGSVNVASDLMQLGLQVLASSLLVSLGVGLSSWTNKLLRGLLIFAALSSLYTLPVMLFGFSRSRGSAFGLWNILDVLVWLVVCVMVMLYFVEYGASQIAPHAENHSNRKRLFAVTVSLLLLPYAFFLERSVAPLAVGLVMMVPFLIDTLCEPVYRIPSLFRPHRKWGPLRHLRYPGWPGNLLVILLLLTVYLAAGFVLEGDHRFTKWTLVFFNIALFPFLFIRLIPFLSRKPIISYFLIQTACLLLFIFFAILYETLPGVFDWVSYAVFPPSGLYEVLDNNGRVEDLELSLLIFPTGIMILVHLIKAIPLWRAMNTLSREADS
jgi:hypothetical protein